MTRFSARSLLATTILAGAVFMTTAAVAQTTPAAGADQQDAAPADVIVTGSRVARPNAQSPSPITTVGGEDIKEFGATKIEDLTNSLPQVFAGQSSGVSNGADGTATLDLRGLGASRTLVLIDGRRLMPGNVGGGAGADLNFIPAALVSSVDLLTGGASSTYGADAVAGVVNFKMNRGFRGLRLDGQYGFFDHNNDNPIRDTVNAQYRAPEGHTAHGGSYDITAALGTGFNDDRGSIVAYAGYREESAVTQAEYDYSTCTLNPDANNVGLACGGSGTPATTRFGGFSAANRAAAGLPAAGSYTLTPTGLRPYSALVDGYNFGPVNYFRRPSKRYTAGAFAEFEVSSAVKPYLDVMFADYSTQAQIAPSGAFYGTRTVNCDNPLLAQNQQLAIASCGANLGVAGTSTQILIGKRNVEGGPRFNDIGYNQFRIVSGVRGDLNDAWSYDAYYQFGQIKVANTYRNDVSSARINNALNVVNVNGVATCAGGDPACVPYNVFVAGGVTQAAANYINIPLVLTGTTKEQVASGVITGNLGSYGIQSPFADDGLRIAGGVEWRKESLATQPDQAYINGDGAGQGGPTLPIAGSYTVFDLYTEAGLPLVTDKPFFHDLTLQLGYRRSKYNVPGAATQNSADTFKIAGNWSLVQDLTLRGSFNRAVRSPNIGELFLNQTPGLFAGTDPCAGAISNGTVNGNTAAQCALTGVTAAQFGNLAPNSAQQYNQLSGGNPDLMPEKADTFSAGVLLTPRSFLKNLVLSVDYYSIKVNNAIGTIGSQVILNQCLATGSADFCSKINRAPASAGPAAGSLWLNGSNGVGGNVNNLTTNTGSLKTSGIEVNGDYRATFGDGWKLRAQFVGVYLDQYVSQPLTGGFSYDCAGYYGLTCGNPAPRYRFNTNIKIATASDIGMTVRYRFLSSVKVDTISPDVDLAVEDAAPTNDEKIGNQGYLDLLFSLPIKDTATLRIGVNNVLDRDPPIISQASLGGFGNGNTFPGTYDTLGRTVFVNLTADF